MTSNFTAAELRELADNCHHTLMDDSEDYKIATALREYATLIDTVEIIAAWLRRNGTDQQADAVLALLEDNEALCEAVDKRIAERDEARALSVQEPAATPSSRWAKNGEPDPHGNLYNCERAALAGGDMTDDELANAAFLDPNIMNLTAMKDRLRWLSRKLLSAQDASPKDGWQPNAVMIEQFCKDLNQAHDELLRAQGATEAQLNQFDWPEWTPQANSIRWAEKRLGKKLAKTDNWTMFPAAPEAK